MHIFGDWIFKLFIQWPQDGEVRAVSSLLFLIPYQQLGGCPSRVSVFLSFPFPLFSCLLLSFHLPSFFLSPYLPPFLLPLPIFFPSFFLLLQYVSSCTSLSSTQCSSRIFFIKEVTAIYLEVWLSVLGLLEHIWWNYVLQTHCFERIYKSGDEAYSWPRPARNHIHHPLPQLLHFHLFYEYQIWVSLSKGNRLCFIFLTLLLI